jgi:hypothetical protein
MKLTEIMFNNNLKLCLEILGHHPSTLLIYQSINGCLHFHPDSTVNIWGERFLKQFHKIVISADVPEGIRHADE